MTTPEPTAMNTSSVASGIRPRSQLAGSDQSPPPLLIQLMVPRVTEKELVMLAM